MIFHNACWSSFLCFIEKRRHAKQIDSTPLPENPVVIIGNWRTGTTLLHHLMAFDNNFVSPNVFDVTFPESSIVSRKYYEPIMRLMLKKTRPMDNVLLHLDNPEEDEFALLRMTASSPLKEIIFPKSSRFFLSQYDNFLPPKKEIDEWTNSMTYFYRKIIFKNKPNKRLLLKNPLHSLRIPYLTKLFPGIKFIHIYRNPYDVVASSKWLWHIMGKYNNLNNKWKDPDIDEISEFINKSWFNTKNELNNLPTGSYYEIKFEDFENNPVGIIKDLYKALDLPYTEEFELKIKQHLIKNKSYKKNNYNLSELDREIISKNLNSYINYYKYNS